MKAIVVILSMVAIAGCGSAKSNPSVSNALDSNGTAVGAGCPTTLLKGFAGTFKGLLSSVNFKGESQPLQDLLETHTVTSCTSFDFDVQYADPQTGKNTREVIFTAQWDKANDVFSFIGPVIKGKFRVIREGQFVASFNTSFGETAAHCEEMMTLMNNDQQLMRSVQCAAGDMNGTSLGVRNALVRRVL